MEKLIASELTNTAESVYKRKLHQLYFDLMMTDANNMADGSKEQGDRYLEMQKKWPKNTRVKMALGWWNYNNKNYTESDAIFSLFILWHKD